MNWYISLTRGKQIAFAVLLAHGLLLAMLGADHWMHRIPLRKKVTVNTFVLTPPPKPVATTTSSAPAPPAPKASPAAPKKTVLKPEAKKAPPQAAPKETARQDNLLSEIEKNLESLTSPPSVVKKSSIAIPALTLQHQTQTVDSSAAEQIAAILQESLELPEFGEVRIKLSINRAGVLETVEILDAKSQKNGEFLKKRLPELQFPCLNEVTTLTVVFSNAL